MKSILTLFIGLLAAFGISAQSSQHLLSNIEVDECVQSVFLEMEGDVELRSWSNDHIRVMTYVETNFGKHQLKYM